MSPEELRQASDQRTQERGPGAPGGDVNDGLQRPADSLQAWNRDAVFLAGSATISCPSIFLCCLRTVKFLDLPQFSVILPVKLSLQVLCLLSGLQAGSPFHR